MESRVFWVVLISIVVAAILALGLCYRLYMTRSKLNLPKLTKAERRDELRQWTAESWDRRRLEVFSYRCRQRQL